MSVQPASWTPGQIAALNDVRATISAYKPPFGTAQSIAERAKVPSQGIPEGVHVSCELAPLPLTSLHPSAQPQSNQKDAKVMLHAHGGGNVSGRPTEERFISFFSRALRALVKKSGTQGASAPIIAAPSHRLATVRENVFPAALQDLFSAYHYLISKGFSAKNITITGDSAGGNLAVILTYIISQSSLQMPGRVVLFSPTADLTHASYTSSSHDIISLSTYQACFSQYLGNFPANNPLASGVLIPFTASWPKTLVMTGTADNTAASSRIIVSRIQEAGGRVELVEYPDLSHAFWMYPKIFPQSDNGLERLATFAYN
ncbi:Alpha/Beta hydrolase protein [Suillus spraguei]|nr:Alpha/Beta hydrolase protein [Suillus spraguei]